MVAIHRFMVLMIDLGKIRALGLVEKQRHIVRESRVIFLESSDIIGLLIGDHLGDLLLASHRINRHRGTSQVPQL